MHVSSVNFDTVSNFYERRSFYSTRAPRRSRGGAEISPGLQSGAAVCLGQQNGDGQVDLQATGR